MFENEQKYLLNGFDRETFGYGFLAGGALTSTFTNEPIRDYDLYYCSEDSFKSSAESAYENGYWCSSVTPRSVTFVQGSDVYQMMHFDWFKTAQEIFDRFDFTACMGAYDFALNRLELHDRFLADVARRQLVFNHKTSYPLASAVRVLKYQKKGFQITKREMLKIVMACNKVVINDFEELADQIGGAYGDGVLLASKTKDGDYAHFDLDSAIEAIDKATFQDPEEPKPDKAREEIITDIFDSVGDSPANIDALMEKIRKCRMAEHGIW